MADWGLDKNTRTWRKDYGDGHLGAVVDDPVDAAFHGVWELAFEGRMVARQEGGNVSAAKAACDSAVRQRAGEPVPRIWEGER